MTTIGGTATSDRSWLDKLDQQCPAFTRPIAFIAVLGMLAVSGMTMLDVLLRWFAGLGVVGLNELVELIFAVTVTACIPYGIAMRINLQLDLLTDWIVGRLATLVDALGMILTLAFLSILTWRLAVHAQDTLAEGKVTLILLWPIAPSMFGIAVLMALAVLAQIVVTANSIRRAAAYRPDPAQPGSPTGAWLFVLLVYGVAFLGVAYGLVDFAGLSDLATANPAIAIALACLFMWLLLMALAPLAAVMGLLGIFGTAFFLRLSPALNAAGSEVAGFLTNSQASVLPLFLMMGSFAGVAGIAEDLYALAHTSFGRVRGGLALSTIGGCAGFGAVTGSTLATTALIARIALPEMMSRGYSPELATGSIAAGGTLGSLVPPAGALILFALLTEASIGQLFIASAVPAVFAIGAYIVTTYIYVRMVPASAPPVEKLETGQAASALKRCVPACALFGTVLGGLYSGVFTDTEAAAVGAFGAFLIALFRGKLRPSVFFRAIGETTETTALIYPLVFAGFIFALFTDVTGVTKMMTDFVGGLSWPPLAIVGLVLAAFVVAGTFMDAYTTMIVTVPIVTPLILGLGYNLVWWGVLNLYVIEIGAISPPFGLTMYVLKDMAKVPIGAVFRGVTPYCVAAILVLAILAIFPEIVLWLPSTMK
jgi:tripartite ATP-independent transporter DctM subunit